MSDREERRKKRQEEKKVKRARMQKVDDFLQGSESNYFPPGEKSFMGYVKDRKGNKRMMVAFDERHLEAVGPEGRDKIRAALEKADKREGLGFIDRTRAMRLERLRYAEQRAEDLEAKEQKRFKSGETPGLGFKFMDGFKSADRVVTYTVFGLSGIFVFLMFYFLFRPILLM